MLRFVGVPLNPCGPWTLSGAECGMGGDFKWG